jgi:flagellar protein FliO/FliZ
MDALTIGSLLRVVLSLAFVIGLLLLVRRWAVRGSGPARNLLKVVARVPLGRNASVAIIELRDRHYLVGIAEETVTLIDRLDDFDELVARTPDDAEPNAGANAGANAVIGTAGGRRGAVRRHPSDPDRT